MFDYIEKKFPIGSIVTLKRDTSEPKKEYKVFEIFKNSGRLIIRSIDWDKGDHIQIKVDESEIEHSTELGKVLYE